ncbi:MAG TPA: ComEC/Rec2 family competence protein, partial [Dissulfurispiraceae bacterium]|nr:ComEC/Rec2 family competence protein [Dissulfurispiraceae bacterium]
MLLFASFLFGCAVFFIRTYFPLAGHLLAASGVIVSGVTAALRTGPTSSRFASAAKKTFVVAVTVAAGFLYAQAFSRPDIPLQEIAGKTISLKGIVATEPVEVSRRQVLFSQTLGVREVRDEEGRTFYPEEVRLLHNSPLVPGKTYHIVAQVPRDAFLLNPWTEDPVLTAFAVDVQEVSGSSPGLIGSLRSAINRRMKSDMSHDSAAFLMAMTTGERSFVTSAMRDDFNATGLAHILSISGTHFGLLFCVLFGLLRFSLKLLPAGILVRLTLFLTPTQVAAALAFPFLGAYLALASPSIPAVRSFIMISLFIVGLLVQRRGFWLNTVLFAAVVIVLADPGALRDLSFQLSFIAVLC